MSLPDSTPARLPSPEEIEIAAASGFGLSELRSGSSLLAQVLPRGGLFALRDGPVLINQLLPSPAEDGLFQLILRWWPRGRTRDGAPTGWGSLVDRRSAFTAVGGGSGVWSGEPGSGLRCETRLEMVRERAGWAWRVRVRNEGTADLTVDVLHAQDLGLADEGAVRNNEAYTSQYIDLLPVRDPALGWTILARQNQPTGQGTHPWLGVACLQGAAAYCTDGWQFFGVDHRLTGVPAAVRTADLPCTRSQYEFALAGLQTRPFDLPRGATAEFVFVARYLPDHPRPSGPDDLAGLRTVAAGVERTSPADRVGGASGMSGETVGSIFGAAWRHGDAPTESDLERWFPGPHRQVERAPDGRQLAFFCGDTTHVVTRAKETVVMRPHGHVLRSGEWLANDAAQFGATVYAAGIFSAQTYLGNPSLVRLLPVVRNALGLSRAAGQRVFLREGGTWRQLGIPSVFALRPDDARWIYRIGDDVISLRTRCARGMPAAALDIRVERGDPREFLVTHTLALGPNEFDQGGGLQLHPAEGWAGCRVASGSLVAQHQPGTAFAIAALDAHDIAALGGDELIYADARRRNGPYLAFLTRRTAGCTFVQLGTTGGVAELPGLVARARAELAPDDASSAPPLFPVTLPVPANPAAAALAEVLPWFNHNAAIHFSAPHGLEQYGGAAWGVRDVCQGSVEWLLAAGRRDVVRQLLTTVFAQQYLGGPAELDGTWPQWFMFPPFQFIQQAHSHGDVCFWPVKALCDYLAASGDLTFLEQPVGYTDPQEFQPRGPAESLWAHCDRVVAHVESRFVADTALVNYGDGDWDDTLQPADPAMRQRMISAWTVGLAFHTFHQLAEVCRRAGKQAQAERLTALLARMRGDFVRHLMPDGIVAGFLIADPDLSSARTLLHPRDRVTGIRHRLLPMTRAMLAELFTDEEARRHLDLIERELRCSDGVRLMSEPATYHGGIETLFRRAETAANVGREIGLQYVHAHLRYAEAMAKLGEADRLWWALQVVNPVGLTAFLPNAELRQSNAYFSSSDADFADRYEAQARWPELRAGRVPVRGGWRLYSSGPGLFLHKVRSCLLGVREHFDEVVFDPVLPRELDGLVAMLNLDGRSVEIRYRVARGGFAPSQVRANGTLLPTLGRERNPYRQGGLRVSRSVLDLALARAGNQLEVEV